MSVTENIMNACTMCMATLNTEWLRRDSERERERIRERRERERERERDRERASG
jgi:hypothetical protein